MIADLKPYPAMKDSGVEWLGQVPMHWESRKLRTVLRRVIARNRPDLPLLSVVREKGVIVRDVSNQDENQNFIPDDLTNYKVVREGQFAINKMKAWQGSYGVSRHDGIVSPAYFVFDFDGVAGDYFNAAIRSKAYVPFFTQASDGVRIGQWDLSQARMREITFFVPPLSEQAAIVRYLDHVDRRVRRLVRAKQGLIALLTEQRQAIIHGAVTRGLDANVPLKDSGVEWLGQVPEHWEVQRLGRISEVFNGSTPSRMEPAYWRGGTVPWLSSSKVNDYVIELPSELVTDRAVQECSISLVPEGAVIIGLVGQGKTRGKAAILAVEACISQNIAAIVPAQSLRSTYLLLFLTAFYSTIREFGRGGNQEALNCGIVSNLRVSVPPLDEQRAIVDRVDSLTLGIAHATATAQREIDLLDEYRTRLIADVVTGKLDVREVAAALPEIDPLSAGDKPEDTIGTHTEADLDELDATVEEAEV